MFIRKVKERKVIIDFKKDIECSDCTYDLQYITGRVIGTIAGATKNGNKSALVIKRDNDGSIISKSYRFYATDKELKRIKELLFCNKLYSKLITII